MAGWQAPRRTTPDGQPRLSDLAIELMLAVRLVFHLALRQAEASTRSALRLLGLRLRLGLGLGLGVAVPGHATLSRRGRGFAGRQPRAARLAGPVHLVPDSTGLQLFGQGEWNAARHGRTRRQWRKLHSAVDAGTGEIAAHVLTEGHGDLLAAVGGADDAAQVPVLLGQAQGSVASVTADGAYEGDPVYRAAAARQHDPPPEVVIKLRARTLPAQQGEAAIAVAALNRMIRAAKPLSVRRA